MLKLRYLRPALLVFLGFFKKKLYSGFVLFFTFKTVSQLPLIDKSFKTNFISPFTTLQC